ncbi:MAG: XisH family protein [Chloroflexota bacterium]|nr:XisH family protein [Chloroflexota bacterium]
MGRSISLIRRGQPPKRQLAHRTTRSDPIAAGTPVAVRDDLPTDWFWEGHVQSVMVAYLRSEGWTITAESNTAIRAQGDDIAAIKDGRRLVVEVKGYPSVGYRDPRRAGEVKRTNPTLQAKHWFADALLKLVRIRGKRPDVSAAMAFPDSPRYRSLVEETGDPLRQLGIGLYFVVPDGRVEVVIQPR